MSLQAIESSSKRKWRREDPVGLGSVLGIRWIRAWNCDCLSEAILRDWLNEGAKEEHIWGQPLCQSRA